MELHCLNCGKPRNRVGRGLCRGCWDDPVIRQRFPRIAEFGGDTRTKGRREAASAQAMLIAALACAELGEACRPLPPGTELTFAEIEALRRRHFQERYFPGQVSTATDGDHEK